MPTMKWTELAASPGFKAAAPEEQEKARIGFFNQHVAPTAPRESLPALRQEWDARTLPKPAAPAANVANQDSNVTSPTALVRPKGGPGFTEGVKDIGRGIARGFTEDLPAAAGALADFVDTPKHDAAGKQLSDDGALSKWGRGVQEAAAKRGENWQQSEYGRQMQERDALSVRGGAFEGGKGLPLSFGPMLAGAATGFAVGRLPGAVVGAIGGSIAALPLFFGSQAKDTYDRVYAETRANNPDLTDEQVHEESMKAGELTGGVEAGGELLADLVGAKLFKAIPSGIKKGLVKEATKGFQGAVPLVKGLAKLFGTEVGTELAQGAAQAEIEKSFGVGEGATWDNQKGVIVPTVIMTLIGGGAAAGMSASQRYRTAKLLQNTNLPAEQRLEAAKGVAQVVGEQDPELANMFYQSAAEQIAGGRPVIAQDDRFYRDFKPLDQREIDKRMAEGDFSDPEKPFNPLDEVGKTIDPLTPDQQFTRDRQMDAEHAAAQPDFQEVDDGAAPVIVDSAGNATAPGAPPADVSAANQPVTSENTPSEAAPEAVAPRQAAAEADGAPQPPSGRVSYTGVDQLINIAKKMGFDDESVRLGTFKKVSALADKMYAEGNVKGAMRLHTRAEEIYRDIMGEDSSLIQTAEQTGQNLPAIYNHKGDVEGSTDLVPGAPAGQESAIEGELAQDPKQLGAPPKRLTTDGVIYAKDERAIPMGPPPVDQPAIPLGPPAAAADQAGTPADSAQQEAVSTPELPPAKIKPAAKTKAEKTAPSRKPNKAERVQMADEFAESFRGKPGYPVDDLPEMRNAYLAGLNGEAAPESKSPHVVEPHSMGGRDRLAIEEGNPLPFGKVPDAKAAPDKKTTAPTTKTEPAKTAPAATERPPILTKTRKAYLTGMALKANLKKSSPGYKDAMARLEEQYEEELVKAQAALPFEEFNQLNSDSPESVNRQAYDALREEFGMPAAEVIDAKASDAPAVTAAIDDKANQAATSALNDRPAPTPAQIAADNYKKGEPFTLHGQTIVIENPRDSMRGDKETAGKKWQNKMAAHYGDIKGTVAADGDNLDVFVGQNPESERIFIIDQQKKNGDKGGFDEHKVMIGFADQAAAEKAYLDSYMKGWGLGPVSELTVDDLKEWIANGDTKSQYSKAASDAKPKQKRKFTFKIKPFEDGFMVGSDDGGGTVMTGRPNAPGILNTVPAKKFKTEQEARDYMQKKGMAEAASKESIEIQSLANTDDVGGEMIANRRTFSGITLKDIDEADNESLQVQMAQKTRVWNRPDYEAMVADGMQAPIAHLLKQVYDSISNKPAHKGETYRRAYVETVLAVRDAAEAFVNDRQTIIDLIRAVVGTGRTEEKAGHTVTTITNMLGSTEDRQAMARAASFILDRAFPKNEKGDRWGRSNPEGNTRVLSIGGRKFITAATMDRNSLMKAMKAVGDGWPAKQELWQRRFNIVEKDGVFQIKKKSAYRPVETAETYEAAVEKARELSKPNGGGETFQEPKVELPNIRREGTDYRQGRNVSTQDLQDIFGFRKINFGDWLKGDSNAAERQAHANHIHDAMMDLADVLGLPPKAMSLNGMLSVAVGAQGRGGSAAAHFVPGVNEINITRNSGAGSLAHEWGHAMDHYFGVMAGLGGHDEPFLSEFADRSYMLKDSTVRKEVVEAYQYLLNNMEWVERIQSPEEMEAMREKQLANGRKSLDRRLSEWRSSVEAKGNAKNLAAFDDLATKLANGERGEMVTLGKSRSRMVGKNVNKMRDLLKLARGYLPSLDDTQWLDSSVSLIANSIDAAEFAEAHEPQVKVRSEFKKRASAKDRNPQKPYWNTRLEMFARAFEMYALDAYEQRSDYMTANWKAEEGDNYLAIEAAERYPRGQEREAINNAFSKLFEVIESKEDGDGVVLFRKDGADSVIAGSRIARKDADKVVARILAGWKDGLARNDEITLHDSFDQLPEAVKQRARDQGVENQVVAVFHNGKIHINLSKIKDQEQLESAIFHETYGHYGLRKLFGKELPAKLSQLHMALGGMKGIREIAERHGKTKIMEMYIRDFDRQVEKGTLTPENRDRFLVDELLAFLQEDNRPTVARLAREILGMIRQAFRRLGYFALEQLSDNEVFALLRQSRQAVQKNEDGKGDGTMFMVAYHGSPHRHNKFTAEKIGTGEGNAAFGWGLYFAQNQSVAETYRTTLSNGHARRERLLADKLGNRPAISRDEIKQITDNLWFQSLTPYQAVEDVLDGRLTSGSLSPEAFDAAVEAASEAALNADDTGQMYRVELPENDELLDWNALLIDQPPAVKEALRSVPWAQDSSVWQHYTGEQLYESEVNVRVMMDGMTRGKAQESVSKELRAAGIPGHRYLDEFSRNKSPDVPAFDSWAGYFKGADMATASDSHLRELRAEYQEFVDQEDTRTRNFVIYDDERIEITDTMFMADEEQDAEEGANTFPASSDWVMPEETKMSAFVDKWIYRGQNKQVDLKRVQKAISDAGRTITEENNAYLKEELFHGRSASRVSKFLENELDPLVADMAARKVSQEDLGKYLWARHAKEANAHIARINPEHPDGGSGMTDAEADAYMADLEPGQRVDFEALAGRIDAIVQETREGMVRDDLISDATKNTWESAYQFYVPLFRDMDGGDTDPMSHGMGTGQGYSIKGAEAKRRTGSALPVADILGNIANARDRAIVRGEKARVGRALYALALTNPNPEFWHTAAKAPLVKAHDKDGMVIEIPDPMFKQRDNVVVVKVKTEQGAIVERAIIFNERDQRAMRMAHTIKNLDGQQLGELLSATASVTRYFAKINTQYNPIFGIINLVRDTQASLVNLSSTPLAGHQWEVAKNAASIMGGALKHGGRRFDESWQAMADEFEQAGGKTGYRDMFSSARERTQDIERALSPDWWTKRPWGKALTANGYLKDPAVLLVDKGLKPIFDWLSDYNDTLENATRLAVYKEARDMGLTPDAAASIAKNISTNFNRKGEMALQVGSLYAFFNAAVQGTTRVLETLSGPAGRRVLAGGIMVGVVQAVMMALAGYDDDEPPQFVRERNLIFPIPGSDGKHMSLAMPLGFHVLPNIGRLMVEIMRGGNPAEKLSSMMAVMADAFNPLGGSAPLAQIAAPTIADPIISLSMNQDWTGKPIAREDFNSMNPTPGFTRSRDIASAPAKAVAKFINAVTGGSDYRKGMASPTGDQIDYLVGQLTGGIGREAIKVATTASALVGAEELPAYKIPLVGRFYGETQGQASHANRFYSNIKRLNAHKAEIEGLRADRKGNEAMEYMRDNPEARLFIRGSKSYQRVQKLRRQRREMVERGASRVRLERIDKQITQEMARLNDMMAAASG